MTVLEARWGGGGGGGHSLIWAIRGRAAGQGMVFWPRCPKQGIQFDLPLSALHRVRTCPKQGMVLGAKGFFI